MAAARGPDGLTAPARPGDTPGDASGLPVIPSAAHFSNVEQPGIFNQAMPGFRDPVNRRQLLRSARNGFGREWDIVCCIVSTREKNNDIRS
ncbi:MAG: hypothetical protein Q7R45_08565 [Sulfuricaulis sp.]|nr:hypothetical protein [Sulfuricaulis sp.]